MGGGLLPFAYAGRKAGAGSAISTDGPNFGRIQLWPDEGQPYYANMCTPAPATIIEGRSNADEHIQVVLAKKKSNATCTKQ